MASPSSILTRGYGAWGGVNLLPTMGYGIGEGEDPFTFDTVCPLAIPLYARTELAVPLFARTELAVPLIGCRNEV